MRRSEPPLGPADRLPESHPPQPWDFRANQSPAARGLSQSSSTFLFVSSAQFELLIVQERWQHLSSAEKGASCSVSGRYASCVQRGGASGPGQHANDPADAECYLF